MLWIRQSVRAKLCRGSSLGSANRHSEREDGKAEGKALREIRKPQERPTRSDSQRLLGEIDDRQKHVLTMNNDRICSAIERRRSDQKIGQGSSLTRRKRCIADHCEARRAYRNSLDEPIYHTAITLNISMVSPERIIIIKADLAPAGRP